MAMLNGSTYINLYVLILGNLDPLKHLLITFVSLSVCDRAEVCIK